MPTALICTLRPAAVASVQANLGRAAHAAILERIAVADASLADRLHSEQGVKPLTVSNVLGLDGRGGRVQVTPARTYGLRVTLLCNTLEAVARTWTADTLGTLTLDGVEWRVEHLTVDAAEHRGAGCESYESLAAAAIRGAGAGPRRWTLEFVSPVTFRHERINHTLPLPELVFGSLLDKWNAFAPLPLPAELRSVVAGLVVSNFDLHSRAVPAKGGALQIGAVGRCAYSVVGQDGAWLAGIDLLARFAFYAGVGAGTARGFGQARLVTEERKPWPGSRPGVLGWAGKNDG